MDYKQVLKQWMDGVAAYYKDDTQMALEFFLQLEPISKVTFNIATIYCKQRDYGKANTFYSKALVADPYFAVASLQKGFTNVMLQKYDVAIDCYNHVLQVKVIIIIIIIIFKPRHSLMNIF